MDNLMKRKAEQILTEAFGEAIRLGEAQDLGGSARSRVLRFPALKGPSSAPTSFIVKQTNSEAFDPTSANDATWFFFNDWASLQFLNQVAASIPLVPAFYGGDRREGLFVMEDLKQGTRLDHLLLGSNPDAAEVSLLNSGQKQPIRHTIPRSDNGRLWLLIQKRRVKRIWICLALLFL